MDILVGNWGVGPAMYVHDDDLWSFEEREVLGETARYGLTCRADVDKLVWDRSRAGARLVELRDNNAFAPTYRREGYGHRLTTACKGGLRFHLLPMPITVDWDINRIVCELPPVAVLPWPDLRQFRDYYVRMKAAHEIVMSRVRLIGKGAVLETVPDEYLELLAHLHIFDAVAA